MSAYEHVITQLTSRFANYARIRDNFYRVAALAESLLTGPYSTALLAIPANLTTSGVTQPPGP
jgi:hypothetical protein